MKVAMQQQGLVQTSTDQNLSIIDRLKSELGKIKDTIKDGKVTNETFEQLTGTAKILQGKLNELLGKKGVLTQSDVNDAYAVLEETKKRELEQLSKKSKRRTLLYVGLGLVGVSLIVMALKK
jgi:uncharacterized protein YjbJ (UPF0337 family)